MRRTEGEGAVGGGWLVFSGLSLVAGLVVLIVSTVGFLLIFVASLALGLGILLRKQAGDRAKLTAASSRAQRRPAARSNGS